uniref:Uncharacterized protein n=1 Tax=Ditylenchus dipsaci TaxID=166011 RepID=A0A915ELZ1_9BILA
MGAQGDQQPEQGEVPRHPVIEDAAWQVQRRVPQENVQQVNPSKIKIPEFIELDNVKPTVIVPQPAESTKVQWNEFPEEEQKEPGSVPRVRAQDWLPQNEVEHVVQKTNYQPGKIARAWPPPGYEDEEEVQLSRATATKAVSDEAWLQQSENQAEENGDQSGKAGWRNQASSGGEIKSRVWPPPDNVQEHEDSRLDPN